MLGPYQARFQQSGLKRWESDCEEIVLLVYEYGLKVCGYATTFGKELLHQTLPIESRKLLASSSQPCLRLRLRLHVKTFYAWLDDSVPGPRMLAFHVLSVVFEQTPRKWQLECLAAMSSSSFVLLFASKD